MAGFVGVHIGAGNHAVKSREEYAKVCKAACKKGAKALADGKSALDAATLAVSVLENSPLSNAGLGSSLTWNGTVECDAGAMEGTRRYWGGAGAVSGVKNPCKLAREICIQQFRDNTLGRIQPCLLVGHGAEEWAKKHKIQLVEPRSLEHGIARRKYEVYKKRVKNAEERNLSMEQLDTVGAVCVDGFGHTAAVCSSGGIALKESGRIGQAAMFGAGCWAEDGEQGRSAVASCTSGCGEHLIRCSLAQRLATSIRDNPAGTNCAPVLNQAMQTHFLDSPFLSGVTEKLGGALVLTCSPEDGSGEFLWAHSTNTFILAYVAVHETPKVIISTLQPGQKEGKGLVGGGTYFNLPALPHIQDASTVPPNFTVTLLQK